MYYPTLLQVVLTAVALIFGSSSSAQNVQKTLSPTVVENVSAKPSTIYDVSGRALTPSAVARVRNDLYFLGPTSLWFVENGVMLLAARKNLFAREIVPVLGKTLQIQEFSDFVYSPQIDDLIILDKAGDVIAFDVQKRSWHVVRANKPLIGLPDPDFVALSRSSEGICLLDPELNQIWNLSSRGAIYPYFREVLPWKVTVHDVNVTNAIGIACDNNTYVIRRNGIVTKYGGFTPGKEYVRQLMWLCHLPKDMRPTRIFTDETRSLYIVERENNRVTVVDKSSGKSCQFTFPNGSNLRGLLPGLDGFYILNGAQLIYKSLLLPDHNSAFPRQLDRRLAGLSLPIANTHLPRHPGVWPGARRLYRYGVHQGIDFFADAGPISMGTPVMAAGDGRVVRADFNFEDMDAQKLTQVMRECYRRHNTSEFNEDLFRGCQVWIDHGDGLITKYAHLNKIKEGLRVGSFVHSGDIVGYVGVSGTGENLPGRIKHPHLHFEIWLDGHYLGWGLTPSETIGVLEDIFGMQAR